MEFGTTSEQDVFAAELHILKEAKADVAARKQPEPQRYEELVRHYEKLLKTTIKLSRISDIQGRTLKEREQELKSAHAELQHMEQLRRQLMSDISHELRTPITSVQGYVKAFLDDVLEPDKSYLAMLYRKLETINQLIADLFQLSTLKANRFPLHFTRVSVRDWYLSLQRKHELEARKKGVRLVYEAAVAASDRVRIQADSAVLRIDTIRIEQVVTNLLDNALRFTPADGTIRVSGRLSDRAPAAAVLYKPAGAGDPPCWFVVTVEDTGDGVGPDDLPYIFERFFRAGRSVDRPAAGAGLGLAISKEIVIRHEGQIGADSVAGRGSRFHFSLPVFDESDSLEGSDNNQGGET